MKTGCDIRMAEAKLCPVCMGKGKVHDENFGKTTGGQQTKRCHGCFGTGWVQVN